MFDHTRLLLIFGHWPFVTAAALHRAALAASNRGRHGTAERFFERAARGYRRDLDVEALARLRTHQLMARVLSGRVNSLEAAIEVERRLARLERIETLTPPFARVDARGLMGTWQKRLNSSTPAPGRASAA